jgi:AP-1 complex subunit gamma-1
MRICRKVPDLQEHFLEKAKLLLNDRNHGVLLCGVTLVIGLCEADEAEGGEEGIVELFKPIVPPLVKVLKQLASSGYAPEHDVTGITDPFLQVKILTLLRVLGRNDTEVSEQINDILAQVATNTDSTKNVGNSILYEAVLTILDIEADSGLRVLGVNILGKFLSNKDNNIRYVALNTLIKVVAVEPQAVQRHRNTILDCLRDPDISIRRRALDLSFTLINESNVRVLIRELLAFLEVADNEFKPILTSQIGVAADRYAPNKRWHIDTMLRVLRLVSVLRPSWLKVCTLTCLGWHLRERANPVVIHKTHRYHARFADLYCTKVVRCAQRRHYTGRAYPSRSLGHWRVRRGVTAWW